VDEGSKLRRQTRNTVAHISARLSDRSSGSTLVADRHDDAHGYSLWSPGRPGEAVLYQQPSSSRLEHHQILSSFMSAMFPLGVTSVQKSFVGSWLWHIPPRLGCCIALDQAALSLALAYFACVGGDQIVLRNAEISYGSALKSLAIAITDKNKACDSTILCATLLLQFYEVNR